MYNGFPFLWLLITLPFVSSILIVLVPALRDICGSHSRITWPIGLAGLGVLLAGLVGMLPEAVALPLMLIGGTLSGLSMFWSPRRDAGSDEGEDWRRRWPRPDEPPPQPLGDGPVDWQWFDRLRTEWERQPISRSVAFRS